MWVFLDRVVDEEQQKEEEEEEEDKMKGLFDLRLSAWG